MSFFEDYNYLYPPDHEFTVRFPYINTHNKFLEFYLYSTYQKKQLKPHRIITPPKNSEYDQNEMIYEWHLFPGKYYIIKRSIVNIGGKRRHYCKPYIMVMDKIMGLTRLAIKWREVPNWIPWTCECVKSLAKFMRKREPKIHPKQRWW